MKGYVITKAKGFKRSDTRLHIFENIQLAAKYACLCESSVGGDNSNRREAITVGAIDDDFNTFDSGWRPDLGDSTRILKSWALI